MPLVSLKADIFAAGRVEVAAKIGTGGRNLQDADANKATNNWEFTSETNHGVLKLSLYPDRYEWAFVTETGTVIDSGSYAVK